MAEASSERVHLSIKFMVTNSLAGSLIGTGGSAIKELIDVSKARVMVSGPQDVYPGTSERIILLAGSEEAVDSCQTLVWAMIALNTKTPQGEKSVWSPRSASESLDEFEDVVVTGKICIPSSAGGLILGRGGSNIKTMMDESGAHLQMTGKEEAFFTQERVITVSGTASVCAKAVSLILQRLATDEECARYANRGTTYTTHIAPLFGEVRSGRGRAGGRYPRIGGGGGGNTRVPRGAPAAELEDAEPAQPTISITLTVPDDLINNVIGKQGTTLREIMSLSNSKVAVSPRGEFVEGTTNRVVTITGSPSSAQTANLLITQKLQAATGASSPGSGGRSPRKALGAGAGAV